MLYKVVLTFESVDKILVHCAVKNYSSFTIESVWSVTVDSNECIEQYCPVVFIKIMLYEAVLTFESMDKILMVTIQIKANWAVLYLINGVQ